MQITKHTQKKVTSLGESQGVTESVIEISMRMENREHELLLRAAGSSGGAVRSSYSVAGGNQTQKLRSSHA